MLVGVALQTAAQNIGMFIGARFIIGFGLTFACAAAPLLTTELSFLTHRGPLTSLYNSSWYSGSIVAAWSTFGTFRIANNWSWRTPSLLQDLSSIAQVALILFISEIPRFFMDQGREEQARGILVKYHCNGDHEDPLATYEIDGIGMALQLDREANSSSSFKSLFVGKVRPTIREDLQETLLIQTVVFSSRNYPYYIMTDSECPIIGMACLAAVCFTIIFVSFKARSSTLHLKETRRRLEEEKLYIGRYKVPLSLAVRDLVEQLDNIIHHNLVAFAHGTPVQRDAFFLFTAFVIAQYLSWAWSIRPELQSLLCRPGQQDHPLGKILDDIKQCLLKTDSCSPFVLYRSHQHAIGEIMSLERDGRPDSRGFTDFARLHSNKDAYEAFRKWFLPIEVGLNILVEAHDSELPPPHERIIELQGHLKRLQELLKAEV
ncbi:hypothetical protein QFC21_003301 [Naganishia friedmannii]|uniref:Uncharacterized protein n=1 Tax=Naganishia friedmannii TaxID=89922 RepID=A0ACC2VPI2_9TREE|nr:hypothetical protein QFC21_003301 [Naganishia friedmannii]